MYYVLECSDDALIDWQRAEDRNRATAQTYDQLGLPEFYALEAFVQWHGEGAET